MASEPIFQIAHLVVDLETAIANWARAQGAGPFFITRHHRAQSFTYRGTDAEADVSYAFGYSGALQVQLIEQHDETPSIYRDMYAAGTGGPHHIARLVDDYATERDRIVGTGTALACELHANGIDACYLDTRDSIGVFTELHSITDRILATFARWHQAHLEWDGVDPIRHHESGS